MADPEESAPAVWDPTARDGAGGWVRRRDPKTAAMWNRAPEPPPQAPAGAPEDGGAETAARAGAASEGRPAAPTADPGDEPTSILPPTPAGPAPGRGPTPGPAPTQFDPPAPRPYLPTARDFPQVTPPQQAAQPPTQQQQQQPGAYGYPAAPYGTQPGYGAPPSAYQPPTQPQAPQAQPQQAPQPPTQPATPMYRPGSYGPPPPASGPPAGQAPYPSAGQAPYQGAQQPAQQQPYQAQPPPWQQQAASQQGAPTPLPYSYDQQYPQAGESGGGFGGPDGSGSGDEPGRRMSPVLLGVLVVVVAALLGVGAVFGLGLGRSKKNTTQPTAAPVVTSAPAQPTTPTDAPSSSAGPSATGGAQAQATAVDQLLDQSAAARAKVAQASTALQACTSPDSVRNAQTLFSQAAASRKTLSQQAAALDVSQIDGGADAMKTLSQAWSESAAADTDYADWAGAVADTCSPGHVPATDSSRAVGAKNSSATNDKNAFVAAWNPIATQYGLKTRSAGAI